MILCISGVCQPISKIFGDPLPVWGNPNLSFYECPWCISSYGWLQLWAQCSFFSPNKFHECSHCAHPNIYPSKSVNSRGLSLWHHLESIVYIRTCYLSSWEQWVFASLVRRKQILICRTAILHWYLHWCEVKFEELHLKRDN